MAGREMPLPSAGDVRHWIAEAEQSAVAYPDSASMFLQEAEGLRLFAKRKGIDISGPAPDAQCVECSRWFCSGDGHPELCLCRPCWRGL